MPERRLTDYHYEKERFIPRYELLKRLLLDEFSSMPAEEEFLPTQEMLAERYKVSRNTVRRALAKLQREGYIQTSTKTGSRILKRRSPFLEVIPEVCRGFTGSFFADVFHCIIFAYSSFK